MTTNPEPIGVSADDFDLMDWFATGTIARRKVVIHNDPALVEQYQELEAQLAAAEKTYGADGAAERSLDEADPRPRLLEQMTALYERWEASKATWTVRALSQDDVEATFDAVPVPKAPLPPLEKAGVKAQERFVEKVNEHAAAKAAAEGERQLHLIAASVESIETAAGAASGVTVDQLRSLRSRPHGAQWVRKLWQAVNAATEGDVDIPRPSSREGSTSTRA